MTFHGATSPRSSLVVSSGNSLKYHKDINNVGTNHSIALGKFSGGKFGLRLKTAESEGCIRERLWPASFTPNTRRW